jgi:DNA-binding NtrC family response regulator
MKVVLTLTDVEPTVRLNAALEQSGVETHLVSPLDDVRGVLRRVQPDVVVITGALLDPQNIALLREQLWAGVPVVGLADAPDATLGERVRSAGFTEIHPKPIAPEDVAAAIRRLADRRTLARETGLYGDSEAIREVLVKIEQMAPVSSTLLVEGESGTGKELVARAMHRLSPRRNRPFIAVSIGALAETLLESELFGHEKGSFTGAAERRLGRFELADTGTLFLDEIGEIPMSTQVKLLRVLEEREVMRVGGTQPIHVDVRVIAATNQSLRAAVEGGAFRSDLYYRLNVLSMYLPPLRQRRGDIPLLVRRFVQEFSAQHERAFRGISAEALQILVDYAWPGNVRELRNLVESMVVLAPGHEIGPMDIPQTIRDGATGDGQGGRFLPVAIGPILQGRRGVDGRELEFIVRTLVELKLQVEELRRRTEVLTHAGWVGDARPVVAIEAPGTPPPPNTVTMSAGMTMAEIERTAITAALRETRGNRRRAAEMLGIGERTLYRKLREYQLLGAEEVAAGPRAS